ncbi:hypothetical protein NLJ89_g11884 [Agrocybe chaxingu]|uniref:Uncharacterized protein n=1 Tax=Agrocybe chaxingu TaxID=84603 RepID=A0A9W8JRK3_9AGAR|nr:hypothetical protein NLJ89_g11884 [Agrocybe chaxingu]
MLTIAQSGAGMAGAQAIHANFYVQIELQFKGEKTTTCDLLVGANGINSAVRKTLLTEGLEGLEEDEKRKIYKAPWTGEAVYRSLIDSEVIRKIAPDHPGLTGRVMVVSGQVAPLAMGSAPKFNNRHFYNMPCTGIKKDLYAPFIRMVNQASVLPGFKLVNVGDHPDGMSTKGKKKNPDIVLYEKDVNTHANKLQYEWLKCFLEFKTLENLQDPFQDPLSKTKHYSLESTTIGGTLCRGQIAGYAAQWCARQHWTHGFAVWIGGYWLTRAQRGYDTTVRLATPTEEALAKEKERPVIVMQVPDGDGFREVIAWAAGPESLTGRATRGYPWDKERKRVVFLKDAWRSGEDDVEKETIMLAKLNASKVQFVPKLICGDDLPGQVTETWTLAAEEWNLGARAEDFAPRVHIRFTEDFIGVDICDFTSSKQSFKSFSTPSLVRYRL